MMPETMSAKGALIDLNTCTHPINIPCDYLDDGCVIFVSSVVTTATVTILSKLLCSVVPVWRETLEGANIGKFGKNHPIANFLIINVLPNVKHKTMFLFSTLVPLLTSGHSISTYIHDTL